MNIRQLLFGICTCLVLIAATSCTPNTAEDDQVYEQGLDKSKVKIPGSD